MMGKLLIEGAHKFYGENHVVKGLHLEVPECEFTVLVGPSGCGKSTLLRMIAGLEGVDAGRILIGGRDVTGLRPKERDIAMVFQSYALYPYLSVYENIAFPLRARRMANGEVDGRVQDAAELLGLRALLDRYPRQLSGGQRQRVAIGRAIVRDAGIFLFDEPLSNLDAKLRDEMRLELKQLHERIGKTFVYVTHDQIEAMTMADRIVLLHDGVIAQEGPPDTLYSTPASRFVAGFIGSPHVNLLPARLEADSSAYCIAFSDNLRLPIATQHAVVLRELAATNTEIEFGIRPDAISVAPSAEEPDTIEVAIGVTQNMGPRTVVQFALGGAELSAELSTREAMRLGGRVAFRFDMERAMFFNRSDGRSLIPLEEKSR
jgi:multiple sugar transport system ATP-binding protein